MLALLLACTSSLEPPPEAQGPVEPDPGTVEASAPIPEHRVFESSAAALAEILKDKPKVLGVGEVHQTTDGPRVSSTISRFTEQLLPVVAPMATDLVLETWAVGDQCGGEEEVAVQVEVETKRPEVTKSEIVILAERAHELGVRPHDLKLSCDDYARVQGDDGEVNYTELLSVLTEKLSAYAQGGLEVEDAMLVLYGGAMHNDVVPREIMADFSYGVAARETGGEKYVELDLYAPELVAGQLIMEGEPWLPLLDLVGPDRALLYERAPKSYVLLMETTLPEGPEVSE